MRGGPSAFVAVALGAPSLLGNRIKSHDPAADYCDQGKQCRDQHSDLDHFEHGSSPDYAAREGVFLP